PEKTSRLSRSRTAVQLRASQPRIFKPVSAIERRSGAYYSSRWQQLADEAVPAGDTCRANKHNVLRLKREALGQGERGGGVGIQLEDLGWLGGDVCRATNDVDRFAVSCFLADATGSTDGVHQVVAGGLETQGQRLVDLSKNVDLLLIVVGQMQLVAVLQIDLMQPGVRAVQVVEVEQVLAAVALEHQAGKVSVFSVDVGLADGLHDVYRCGGHWNFTASVERAGEHDALAAVAQQVDVYLRAIDVIGKAACNLGSQLFNGAAGCVDVTDIGIEERAIRANQATVGIKLLLRAGRRSQFGVIPNGNVEQIVGTDAIGFRLVVDQFLLAGRASVGRYLAREHFRRDAQQLYAAVFRFCSVLELIR